jgi:hypothetical protein
LIYLYPIRKHIDSFASKADLPSGHGVIPPRPAAADGSAPSRVSSADAVTNVAAQAMATKQSEAITIDSEAESRGQSKVEALKSAIMARNIEKSAAAEKEIAARARVVKLQRLRALPAFCDLLRMLFNRRRRTVLATSECLRTLVEETTISAEEYRWRIHLVCEVVPDFITIISPDDISPIEHIKVNVYCNYTDCMKRLQAYIDAA